MTSLNTSSSNRSVRHRGAGVIGVGGAVVLALSGTLTGMLSAPEAASAATTAATFSITTLDGTLFPSSRVTITGTKDVNGTVRVPSLTGGDPHCIVASAQETWSCSFDVPDGAWDVAVYQDLPTDPVTTSELTVGIRVLGAPTIDGGDHLYTTGIITGTGYPGAGIVISGSGPEPFSGDCPEAHDPGGYWSCPLRVNTEGDYTITVQQAWPGTDDEGGMSTRTVTIDRTPPPLPVITGPSAGERITSQPVTFAGTGENGARVDVFIDGSLVCAGTVASGQWSCTAAGITSGDHTVQAIQWDAAGNPSGVSAGIPVTVGTSGDDGGAGPPVPARPDPDPDPAPASPTPEQPPAPSPPPSGTPIPGIPFFPPPIGGNSGLPPGATWGTPTDYGAAIPSLPSSWEHGSWPLGLALGVGFIALVALPLRLLASALRGRISWRHRQFAGRNRQFDADAPDDAPLLGPWVKAAGALTAAVLLAALAGGIQGETRYLRLAVAIGIGLAVLNGVGIVLAARLAGATRNWRAGIRLVPLLLAAAALAALVSRSGGIQPPVIVGVVLAVATSGLTVRRQGGVGLAQLLSTTALALGAWLTHSALGPVVGFWPSLASETLAALCLAAFGSVMLLLLPVGGMPGQLLFDWSRGLWLGVALVASTLAAVVIAGSPTFPLAWAIGIALVFATVSVATWSWIRFVEPTLNPRVTPGL